MCVCVDLSASSRGRDHGSQQGLMCLCICNGRYGVLCPSSGCICQGLDSDCQAGPAAGRTRGLGARYRGGCKSGLDTREINVTRWSKPATSEAVGSGADWDQFACPCLCMRQLELRGSKGQLLGPCCTRMYIFSTNGPSSWPAREGTGWGRWCRLCVWVFLSGVMCACVCAHACVSSTSKREEQFLVSPGHHTVSFPIHQVRWVLGVRGTSAEANMWIIKARYLVCSGPQSDPLRPQLQQKGTQNSQLVVATLLQCGDWSNSASLLQAKWELCSKECVI